MPADFALTPYPLEHLTTLTGHTALVRTLAFSPDDRRLASVSWDRTVRVWDLATGAPVAVHHGHTKVALGVAFSSDGERVISGGNAGELMAWSIADHDGPDTLHASLGGGALGLVVSPDGRHLVTAGNAPIPTVLVWDVESGDVVSVLTRDESMVTGNVEDVDWSFDGRWIGAGYQNGRIQVWDATTFTPIRVLEGHRDTVHGFEFHPAKAQAASASRDRTVRVWNVEDWSEKFVLTGHRAPVWYATYSPDGTRIASSDESGFVHLWDPSDGESVHEFRAHGRRICKVQFSPDGRILSTSSDDGTAKLWNTSTWEEPYTLDGHTDVVYAAVFTPDGRRVATCSRDLTIKLWDVELGREPLSLNGHGSWVFDLAFCGDGSTLASGGDDQTVRLWDTEPTSRGFLAVDDSVEGMRLTVAEFFEQRVLLARVEEALIDDASLSTAERRAGQRIARQRGDDPERLNDLAWETLREPSHSPEEYAEALLFAERAVSIAPSDFAIRNTLGAALFRAGDAARASEELDVCVELRGRLRATPHPADLAFRSMARRELGRTVEAERDLELLRRLVESEAWRENEESRALLAEVDPAWDGRGRARGVRMVQERLVAEHRRGSSKTPGGGRNEEKKITETEQRRDIRTEVMHCGWRFEHLCRYVTRPPLSTQRLSLNEQGKVVHELHVPFRDGPFRDCTTHFVFDPLTFIERLAALDVIARILGHLGIDSTLPTPAPARPPPQLEFAY